MNWGNIAQLAAAFIAFIAFNAATIRWLLDRREGQHWRDLERVEEIAKEVTNLKIALPIEYVRREDWIRFSGTLDGKLDDMRAEMRDELRELRDLQNVRRD